MDGANVDELHSDFPVNGTASAAVASGPPSVKLTPDIDQIDPIDALSVYMPFQPHSNVEDKELEAQQVALVNKCITPVVRQNLNQLYVMWEVEETRLHTEAETGGKAPFGACYAGMCPVFGHFIKPGSTMRSPMVRIRELSTSGVPEPFQLVAAVYCYWPREVSWGLIDNMARWIILFLKRRLKSASTSTLPLRAPTARKRSFLLSV